MHNAQKQHDFLVNHLLHHPEKLDINPDLIMSRTSEYEMYVAGRLTVVPDLHFNMWDTHQFYEIKTSNSKRCMTKADHQVQRMYEWLSHYGSEKKVEIFVAYPKYRGPGRLLEELIIEQR